MKRLKSIILLLFSSSAFAKAENIHSGVELEDAKQRATNKQTAYSSSLFYVASVIFLGIITAEIINKYIHVSFETLRVLRVISIFIISWAVLSRLGYETNTFKSSTLLEIASKDSYKLSYLIL